MAARVFSEISFRVDWEWFGVVLFMRVLYLKVAQLASRWKVIVDNLWTSQMRLQGIEVPAGSIQPRGQKRG